MSDVRLRQLDLNLLVVLDTLLAEQHVTRAAKRLRMSQPATSAALGRLRRALGDELLVKHGHQLQLTPRATSMIDPVRDVLAAIEETIVRPPSFDPARDHRTFTLHASDYIGSTLVPALLGRLSGWPAVRLDLAPVSDRWLAALQRDEIDVVVVPDQLVGGEPLPECSRLPLIADRFVGAVWSGHPHAGGRLTADALGTYPYLQLRTTSGRGIAEQDLDVAGITRHVAATTSSILAMPFLLTGTPLVALVPERLGRRVAAAAGITLLEPDFALRPLRQSAYWHSRRDPDPGHVWFREQLLAVADPDHQSMAGSGGPAEAASSTNSRR